MINYIKPETRCFGQILSTLYHHLEEALFDGVKYEIIELKINEEDKIGEAFIKMNNSIKYWYFISELDIWVIE